MSCKKYKMLFALCFYTRLFSFCRVDVEFILSFGKSTSNTESYGFEVTRQHMAKTNMHRSEIVQILYRSFLPQTCLRGNLYCLYFNMDNITTVLYLDKVI